MGVALRHEIGIDNICWEMDYPHSDSTWPDAPETLDETLTGVPDDEVDKITHLNAMAWYQYDPFTHIDRADCTVGALRALAADHDISVQSMDKGRHEGKDRDLVGLASRNQGVNR